MRESKIMIKEATSFFILIHFKEWLKYMLETYITHVCVVEMKMINN